MRRFGAIVMGPRGTRMLHLAAVLLVLLALLLTLARLALWTLSQHPGWVARVLEQRLEQPVRIGAQRFDLAGWQPRVRLHDAALLDPISGEPLLRADWLEIRLAPLATLLAGAPRLASLTLVGARIELQPGPAGGLEVLGLTAIQGGDSRLPRDLLVRTQVRVRDSEVRLRAADGMVPIQRWSGIEAEFVHRGWWHRYALAADWSMPESSSPAPTGTGVRLEARALLRGPAGAPDHWDGTLHTRLRGRDWPTGVAGLRLATGDLEGWIRVRAGQWRQGLWRFDLDGLSGLAADRGVWSTLPEQLSGWLRIRPAARGQPWQLDVGELRARLDGFALPRLDARLEWTAGGFLALRLASEPLDLAALTTGWSMARPASPSAATVPLRPWRQLWRAAALQGTLHGLEVTLERPDLAQPVRWQVAVRGEDLGLGGSAGPGIRGLDAQARVTERCGAVRLDSRRAVTVRPYPLLDHPIQLDALVGDVSWSRDPQGGWRIRADDLVAHNADLYSQARFALALPGDGRASHLQLRARVGEVEAGRVRPYLPVGRMHPDLVNWLEQSLQGGRMEQLDVLFRGPPAAFPFRDRQGRFELQLRFTDVLLRYLPDWPPLEAARGQLRFIDQGLTIEVAEARLLDSEVSAGLAVIEDLWGPRRLPISAVAEGPFADGQRILVETPLAGELGTVGAALHPSGRSRLELDLGVPLAADEPLTLRGRLSWPSTASVALRDTPFLLEELAGELVFTERDVEARGVQARLWDRPLQLDILTQAASGDRAAGTRIEIVARSATPIPTLAAHWPTSMWTVSRGELDWTLGLTLRHAELRAGRPRIDYRLASTLHALTLDLPAPLGKGRGTRPLDLRGFLEPGGSGILQGRLGELALSLDLAPDAQGVRPARAHLRLGGEAAPTPERLGWFLDGRLAELDLPAWQGTLARLNREQGPDRRPPRIAGARLRIERLAWGGAPLHEVSLAATPAAGGAWSIDLDARELEGRLTLPPARTAGQGAPSMALIDLERLDLAALRPVTDASANPSPPRGLDPLPWPLELRVADLRWGTATLGPLGLQLRPESGGLQVRDLTLGDGRRLRLDGEGQWRAGAEGGRSYLALTADTRNLSGLLRDLGSRGALDAASATARAVLEWPGGFGDFDLAEAQGTIDLDLGAGRLLEVEPGWGRVLGVLNLGALSRRLAMDFSDLYGQGFAFERLHGHLVIGDGQALVDGLRIEGPAGDLRIDGMTDLAARRLYQDVIVEPKLGTSVALASAVAGGPVVGAAVYLVDRVAGNAIDRLGRSRYRISGPWEDPRIERLGWEGLNGLHALQTPRAGEHTGERAGETPAKPKAGTAPAVNHFLDQDR